MSNSLCVTSTPAAIVISDLQNISLEIFDEEGIERCDLELSCTDWSSAMMIETWFSIVTDKVRFRLNTELYFDTDATTSKVFDLEDKEARKLLIITDMTDITDIEVFDILNACHLDGTPATVEIADSVKLELANLIKNSVKHLEFDCDFSDHPMYN